VVPSWGLPVPLGRPTFALGSVITVTPRGCNAEVTLEPVRASRPPPRPFAARYPDGLWQRFFGSDLAGSATHALVGREAQGMPAWAFESACATKWAALEFVSGEPFFVMTAPCPPP
jgi:hypothetical protein